VASDLQELQRKTPRWMVLRKLQNPASAMNLTEVVKKYTDGMATLMDWVGSGGRVVNIPQAQNRTNICLKCPNNLPGGVIPESVAWAIKKQMELKNSIGLKTEGIKDLKTCSLCSCYLPLKIFVPLENLGVDEKEALELWPQWCWIPLEYKQKQHEADTYQI
jgi:hypothetical protein